MKPITDQEYANQLKQMMSTAHEISAKLADLGDLVVRLPYVPGNEEALRQRQFLEHNIGYATAALSVFLDAVEYNPFPTKSCSTP